MSSADVSKFAVVDPRVLQTKPKYAVEKGALSLTNQSFTSIANSDSQVAWNVQVPSENIFVDREIRWSGSLSIQVQATRAAAIANGAPVVVPGLHFATAAFPFHQCVSTMSTTINDATCSVNTQDVMNQVLRLADQSESRKQRTCPTMLDRYAIYPDSADVAIHNSPLDSYGASYNPDEQPNGAWGRLTFTAGTNTTITNGLPVNNTGGASAGPFTFIVTIQSSEKLLLSPFIFADKHGLSTGLFGVQNIQVLANLASPSRVLRFSPSYFSGTPTLTYSTATPFSSPRLNVQFLTPALDVPLPPKSIVPYMEYPRYITPVTASWTTATTGLGLVNTAQVTSNTITLPNIPDLLMIYVRPTNAADIANTRGDYVHPISQISINFDNFSGLLAGHTQEQLYEMSVANGLDMDWNTWSGVASLADAGALAASGRGAVATAGGPLVLRPGRDITLQAGQAPGLVGNFTFQFTAQITSYLAAAVGTSVSIYVVAVSSGFFETIKGSSRIIKGVLTESDILSAPMAAPSAELQRDVGAAKPMKQGRATHSAMSKYM